MSAALLVVLHQDLQVLFKHLSRSVFAQCLLQLGNQRKVALAFGRLCLDQLEGCKKWESHLHILPGKGLRHISQPVHLVVCPNPRSETGTELMEQLCFACETPNVGHATDGYCKGRLQNRTCAEACQDFVTTNPGVVSHLS